MGLGTNARRWFGGLLLATALGLLIAGETIFKGKLAGGVFVLYWLLCLVLTAAAIVVAWLDACAVQRKGRREARELVENTLGKIETDLRQKPRAPETQEGQ